MQRAARAHARRLGIVFDHNPRNYRGKLVTLCLLFLLGIIIGALAADDVGEAWDRSQVRRTAVPLMQWFVVGLLGVSIMFQGEDVGRAISPRGLKLAADWQLKAGSDAFEDHTSDEGGCAERVQLACGRVFVGCFGLCTKDTGLSVDVQDDDNKQDAEGADLTIQRTPSPPSRQSSGSDDDAHTTRSRQSSMAWDRSGEPVPVTTPSLGEPEVVDAEEEQDHRHTLFRQQVEAHRRQVEEDRRMALLVKESHRL